MMTVLLVFKTLSMLFESIRYHYLGLTGAAEAWSIVYYLFAFLKGITLFVVVLLIGSGWSLIKPFLHSRDKRIIMVVLSLQVGRSNRLPRIGSVAGVLMRMYVQRQWYWLTQGGLQFLRGVLPLVQPNPRLGVLPSAAHVREFEVRRCSRFFLSLGGSRDTSTLFMRFRSCCCCRCREITT